MSDHKRETEWSPGGCYWHHGAPQPWGCSECRRLAEVGRRAREAGRRAAEEFHREVSR